jgi:CyaY protein
VLRATSAAREAAAPGSASEQPALKYLFDAHHDQDTDMTEAEFLSLYQNTLKKIEETVEAAINEQDADIDYESGNDMLTLSFANRTVVIISRQSAIRQLWVAARSGGFHYDYDAQANTWRCASTGQPLPVMLSRFCQEQGAVALSFD